MERPSRLARRTLPNSLAAGAVVAPHCLPLAACAAFLSGRVWPYAGAKVTDVEIEDGTLLIAFESFTTPTADGLFPLAGDTSILYIHDTYLLIPLSVVCGAAAMIVLGASTVFLVARSLRRRSLARRSSDADVPG